MSMEEADRRAGEVGEREKVGVCSVRKGCEDW
jgi:hypothetical protein